MVVIKGRVVHIKINLVLLKDRVVLMEVRLVFMEVKMVYIKEMESHRWNAEPSSNNKATSSSRTVEGCQMQRQAGLFRLALYMSEICSSVSVHFHGTSCTNSQDIDFSE